MSTTLGGVLFDHDPIWIDEFDQEMYQAMTYISLDGTENVSMGNRKGHYCITLETTEQTGWLSGSTIDALVVLARVQGATYILDRNGVDVTVRFRHEVSGGPIQMQLLIPTAAPKDNTWYYGKIYLMCTG